MGLWTLGKVEYLVLPENYACCPSLAQQSHSTGSRLIEHTHTKVIRSLWTGLCLCMCKSTCAHELMCGGVDDK